MVEQTETERKSGSPIIYTNEPVLNSTEAFAGRVAVSKGLAGITATTLGGGVQPEGTHVRIQATAEGQQWLLRLLAHPLTRAASLLLEVRWNEICAGMMEDSAQYIVLQYASRSQQEAYARRLRTEAEKTKTAARELLDSQDASLLLPNTDLASLQGLIEEAADQLLHPPTSVAPVIR